MWKNERVECACSDCNVGWVREHGCSAGVAEEENHQNAGKGISNDRSRWKHEQWLRRKKIEGKGGESERGPLVSGRGRTGPSGKNVASNFLKTAGRQRGKEKWN